MTRLEALIELRDKVKAGEGNRNDGTLYRLFGDDWVHAWDVLDRGSLNAAKALHEAVLHESTWVNISYSKRYAEESRAEVTHATGTWQAATDNPARAWLIAILEALIAQERPT